jgi:SAM-dependent methyltransferase
MESARIERLERLNDYQLNINHPFYLHYRTLFADLRKASTFAQGRLLDIGCGNKPYKEMFVNRTTEYVGCDVAQSSDHHVDIICPATDIPLPDESFNTILCTQVIEHVADHRRLIEEAFRLLQRGGILILSGPMYWPLHEEPYDFFRFTEHGLRYLVESAGFKVGNLERNGGKWALSGQAMIHAIQHTKADRPIVIRSINRMFGYLDKRCKTGTPINYLMMANKP